MDVAVPCVHVALLTPLRPCHAAAMIGPQTPRRVHCVWRPASGSRMRFAAPLLVISMLLARGGFAAGDGTPDVRAGDLRVRAIADPWQLVFEDANGATILTEFPGTSATAAGTLGFRTAA